MDIHDSRKILTLWEKHQLVKTYERRVLSLRYSTGPRALSDREFILGKIFHGENSQVRKMHFLCQGESLLRVLMALLEIL